MPLLGSLATPDFGKGFRKKAFQTITLPTPAINTPVKVATISNNYYVSWLDVEIDLWQKSVIKKNTSGTLITTGVSFDSDAEGYAFTTGETYVWYLVHEPYCGSTSYYQADLQVDRVSTDNTLTNFKTFGNTTTGFDPHVGSSFWYQRYKGVALSGSSYNDYQAVDTWATNMRNSTSTYLVQVGTTSHNVWGDVGGTGSSGTGLTTNRAGSTTGYYVYNESSGSSTQFNCSRYFIHQLPGLWTVGSSSTSRKWGVSLGMNGTYMRDVHIYAIRNS